MYKQSKNYIMRQKLTVRCLLCELMAFGSLTIDTTGAKFTVYPEFVERLGIYTIEQAEYKNLQSFLKMVHGFVNE